LLPSISRAIKNTLLGVLFALYRERTGEGILTANQYSGRSCGVGSQVKTQAKWNKAAEGQSK
jgi:hypothetical protein